MITIGSTVTWNGRRGSVTAIGFSQATHRQIATVAFSHRETLRVPLDELEGCA